MTNNKPGWIKANHVEEDGYGPFTLFEAGEGEGEAKWVLADHDRERYFGVYRITEPLAPGSDEYHLTLDDYLVVLEGKLAITWLETGEEAFFEVGDMAFLPAGSRIRVAFPELPFKESTVLSRPPDA